MCTAFVFRIPTACFLKSCRGPVVPFHDPAHPHGPVPFVGIMASGNYTCTCNPGWRNENCSVGTGCDAQPCKNGATCTASGGNYHCACASGWKSTDCSQVCPCQNNGTWIPSGGDHKCACKGGWGGPNCTDAPTGCDDHPCKHNGTCTPSGGNYSCACKDIVDIIGPHPTAPIKYAAPNAPVAPPTAVAAAHTPGPAAPKFRPTITAPWAHAIQVVDARTREV